MVPLRNTGTDSPSTAGGASVASAAGAGAATGALVARCEAGTKEGVVAEMTGKPEAMDDAALPEADTCVATVDPPPPPLLLPPPPLPPPPGMNGATSAEMGLLERPNDDGARLPLGTNACALALMPGSAGAPAMAADVAADTGNGGRASATPAGTPLGPPECVEEDQNACPGMEGAAGIRAAAGAAAVGGPTSWLNAHVVPANLQ